jgi:diaminopimelate decarboxylase
MPQNIKLSLQELEIIASQYGTPYNIYDETMIRENARNFMKIFRTNFPNFRQFFAVKALPNPAILKILLEEGMGFDCSSPSEIYIAKQIGASGNQIMYTSNYTSKEDILNAVENKVILNLDGIDELYDVDPSKCELICFRLNPNIGKTDSETASNILGGKDSKFGIDMSSIISAYVLAKERGFKKFGIHCMTGSNIMDPTYWYFLVGTVYKVIENLLDLDIRVDFINLGGGIGIPYHPDKNPIDINLVAQYIFQAMTENKLMLKIDYDPAVYMENGRYITGPYGWLVSRCQRKKYMSDNIFYGLDACMTHLMRPGMYGAYHHITIPRLAEVTETKKANCVGSLCENNDWFARDRNLPVGIEKGDLFVIHSCGSHSQSMGFNYNGKLKCAELLIKPNKTIIMIRKPENYDSLFGNCIY